MPKMRQNFTVDPERAFPAKPTVTHNIPPGQKIRLNFQRFLWQRFVPNGSKEDDHASHQAKGHRHSRLKPCRDGVSELR
jgi:hypothetical protein